MPGLNHCSRPRAIQVCPELRLFFELKANLESSHAYGDRCAILLTWAKAALFDCGDGGFREAMSEAADDADVPDAAVFVDDHIQHDGALDTGCFGRIGVA